MTSIKKNGVLWTAMAAAGVASFIVGPGVCSSLRDVQTRERADSDHARLETKEHAAEVHNRIEKTHEQYDKRIWSMQRNIYAIGQRFRVRGLVEPEPLEQP